MLWARNCLPRHIKIKHIASVFFWGNKFILFSINENTEEPQWMCISYCPRLIISFISIIVLRWDSRQQRKNTFKSKMQAASFSFCLSSKKLNLFRYVSYHVGYFSFISHYKWYWHIKSIYLYIYIQRYMYGKCDNQHQSQPIYFHTPSTMSEQCWYIQTTYIKPWMINADFALSR